MTAIAAEVLADIDKDTVDFVENYDGTRMQPSVLPGQAAQPAHQRLGGHRRGHGHQHPAAQSRRGRARHAGPHRRSRAVHGPALRVPARPRPAHRRHDLPLRPASQPRDRSVGGDRRHPRHVRARTRPRRDAGTGRLRGDARWSDGHRRHGHPVPGQQGLAAREDRRPGEDRQDRRHRRHARRIRSRRHAHRHRVQEGRRAAQGAQQPLQAHAPQDGLQRQRRGARRRPAPDAAPQGAAAAPHRVAPRGRPPAHRVRPPEGPGPGAHPRRPQDRARQPRCGHPRPSASRRTSRTPAPT